MSSVPEQPRILGEGNGEEKTRLEREALVLLGRIRSDLDSRAFTLGDVREGVNERYDLRHLDYLVQEGLIELDADTKKYAVTPKGYEYEEEEGQQNRPRGL